MNNGHDDLTCLPDRIAGMICLVIAAAMCTGAGAVMLAGATVSLRTYGAAFLCPPALGMLWIGLDLVCDMRLSKAWKNIGQPK